MCCCSDLVYLTILIGNSLVVSVYLTTASKLQMDTATPPRQSVASTIDMTSQRRSSISSQVR